MLNACPRHAWACCPPRSPRGLRRATVTLHERDPGGAARIPATELRPDGAGPFPAVVCCTAATASPTRRGSGPRWLRDMATSRSSSTAGRRADLRLAAYRARTSRTPSGSTTPMGALRYLTAAPYVDRASRRRHRLVQRRRVRDGRRERAEPRAARARGVVLPAPGFAAAVGDVSGRVRLARGASGWSGRCCVLIGDADDWTLAPTCARDGGGDARPGRRHDDRAVSRAPTTISTSRASRGPCCPTSGNRNKPGGCCGATVAYDPAAAADARRRVEEFFGYHLRASAERWTPPSSSSSTAASRREPARDGAARPSVRRHPRRRAHGQRRGRRRQPASSSPSTTW